MPQEVVTQVNQFAEAQTAEPGLAFGNRDNRIIAIEWDDDDQPDDDYNPPESDESDDDLEYNDDPSAVKNSNQEQEHAVENEGVEHEDPIIGHHDPDEELVPEDDMPDVGADLPGEEQAVAANQGVEAENPEMEGDRAETPVEQVTAAEGSSGDNVGRMMDERYGP
ncbi:hypothetical protein ACA910_017912 [Epithemia clementina (nom. ined.)]